MCISPLATDPNKITVSQSPTEIHISIGDCAEIACIWEKPVVRYRLSWYLVNEENITKTISSKLFYVSNVTHESKDVLVIKSANVNDTGFYYCEIIIEIPFCKKIRGNGTTVTVEGRGKLARTYACHLACHHKDSSVWTILYISSLSHIPPSMLWISGWMRPTQRGPERLLMTIDLSSLP